MNCLFCDIANKKESSKILYEDDLVIAIMDAYPNVDGHTLIIPKKHYTTFMDLDNDILDHIFSIAKKLTPMIMEKLNCSSLSLCINYGDSQVIKHFHLHLLPNYGSKPTHTIDEIYDILK